MPRKSNPSREPVKAAPSAVSPLTLLTPTDAAEVLGVGRTKLLSLVRSGRIGCRMLDGRIRIPVEAIQEFRDALPQGYVAGKPVKAEAEAAA